MTEPTPTAYDDWEDGFDDDGHEDTCAHDEYEVDWEGRASCNYCRHHWWLTAAQLEAHHEAEAQFMAEYDRLRRREESRFWRTVDWVRSIWRTIRPSFRRRAKAPAALDDDLPF